MAGLLGRIVGFDPLAGGKGTVVSRVEAGIDRELGHTETTARDDRPRLGRGRLRCIVRVTRGIGAR